MKPDLAFAHRYNRMKSITTLITTFTFVLTAMTAAARPVKIGRAHV